MAVTLWIDLRRMWPQNPAVMTSYLKPELLVNHPGRGHRVLAYAEHWRIPGSSSAHAG